MSNMISPNYPDGNSTIRPLMISLTCLKIDSASGFSSQRRAS